MSFIALPYILQKAIIAYADIEGPDQPERMRRLIWAFVVRICPQIYHSGRVRFIYKMMPHTRNETKDEIYEMSWEEIGWDITECNETWWHDMSNNETRVRKCTLDDVRSAKIQISLWIRQSDLNLHRVQYNVSSWKHTYVILTPLNPTFI